MPGGRSRYVYLCFCVFEFVVAGAVADVGGGDGGSGDVRGTVLPLFSVSGFSEETKV